MTVLFLILSLLLIGVVLMLWQTYVKKKEQLQKEEVLKQKAEERLELLESRLEQYKINPEALTQMTSADMIINFLKRHNCEPKMEQNPEVPDQLTIMFQYQGGHFQIEGNKGLWRLVMPVIDSCPLSNTEEVQKIMIAASHQMVSSWGGKLACQVFQPSAPEHSESEEEPQPVMAVSLFHDIVLNPAMPNTEELLNLWLDAAFNVQRGLAWSKNRIEANNNYLRDIDFTPGVTTVETMFDKNQFN